MRLSELQRKDIISISDGRKVGKIIDVDINASTGEIEYIVIETTRLFRSILSNERDINIKFNQIKKLGEDVILVDTPWLKVFFLVILF